MPRGDTLLSGIHGNHTICSLPRARIWWAGLSPSHEGLVECGIIAPWMYPKAAPRSDRKMAGMCIQNYFEVVSVLCTVPRSPADTWASNMETMMYMCLVWNCPAWLPHYRVQLPWKEDRWECSSLWQASFSFLCLFAKAASLVTILWDFYFALL